MAAALDTLRQMFSRKPKTPEEQAIEEAAVKAARQKKAEALQTAMLEQAAERQRQQAAVIPELIEQMEELLQSRILNNYKESANYDKLKSRRFMTLYNKIQKQQKNPMLPSFGQDLITYLAIQKPAFLDHLIKEGSRYNIVFPVALAQKTKAAVAARKVSIASTVTNASSVTVSSRASTPVENNFGINLSQALPYEENNNNNYNSPDLSYLRRHIPPGKGPAYGGSKRRHRKTRRRSPCKRKTRRSRRGGQTRRH